MPRKSADPTKGISITFPESVLKNMDTARGSVTRTVWVNEAVTQRLDREAKKQKVKP